MLIPIAYDVVLRLPEVENTYITVKDSLRGLFFNDSLYSPIFTDFIIQGPELIKTQSPQGFGLIGKDLYLSPIWEDVRLHPHYETTLCIVKEKGLFYIMRGTRKLRFEGVESPNDALQQTVMRYYRFKQSELSKFKEAEPIMSTSPDRIVYRVRSESSEYLIRVDKWSAANRVNWIDTLSSPDYHKLTAQGSHFIAHQNGKKGLILNVIGTDQFSDLGCTYNLIQQNPVDLNFADWILEGDNRNHLVSNHQLIGSPNQPTSFETARFEGELLLFTLNKQPGIMVFGKPVILPPKYSRQPTFAFQPDFRLNTEYTHYIAFSKKKKWGIARIDIQSDNSARVADFDTYGSIKAKFTSSKKAYEALLNQQQGND
jgi:hypothetical protein